MSDDLRGDTTQITESLAQKNQVPSNNDVNKVIAESKTEAETKAAKPIENTVAELLRKVNKFSDLDKKMDQLLNYVASTQSVKAESDVKAEIDPDTYMTYAQYQAFEAQKASQGIKKQQEAAFNKAKELFPELDQSSEGFDSKFFQLADRYFADINPNDPEAPLKAAKLAAIDLGKVEKLTKSKVLNDDARRSRILAEGGNTAKDTKPEPRSKMNDQRLKNLLGVDPEKVKARIKANPTRYGKD